MAKSSPPPARKPLFLLAEDDPTSVALLERFLSPFSRCMHALTGAEALKIFEEQSTTDPVWAVLLDMNLPDTIGVDILAKIRAAEKEHNLPPVHVVMITGDGDKDRIEQSRLLGAAGYLLKPIDGPRYIRELQRMRILEDPSDEW
jgi:CheY-like chemotaxis protein